MRGFAYLALWALFVACGTSSAVSDASSTPPSGSSGVLAETPASQPGERISEASGAVVQVGNFGFGLVPDADSGTRYAPTKTLSEDFQVDGLRVVFSGVVEESPRGVRLWGTPLRVTAIRRVEE